MEVSSNELLTDGNSKSFWLTRLRMYSIRYWFPGHANFTGGVRVLIAVTMVCHKPKNHNTFKSAHQKHRGWTCFWDVKENRSCFVCSFLKLKPGKSIWGYFCVCVSADEMDTVTHLNSLFNIILDVLDFLLLLSETNTKVHVRDYCCTGVAMWASITHQFKPVVMSTSSSSSYN